MRCFQYKIINNILFLKKRNLFIFGISETPLCSDCHTKKEATFHIFFECCKTQSLWEELRKFFHDYFFCLFYHHRLTFWDFQTFQDVRICCYLIISFLFLSSIFIKLGRKILHLKMLLTNISDVKRIEKKMLQLRKIWIGIRKCGKKPTKNFQFNIQNTRRWGMGLWVGKRW